MSRRPITLRDRLIIFFISAPEEELSVSDMELKFNFRPRSCGEALRPMAQAGLLSVRKEGRRHIFSAGPELLQAIARIRESTGVAPPVSNA